MRTFYPAVPLMLPKRMLLAALRDTGTPVPEESDACVLLLVLDGESRKWLAKTFGAPERAASDSDGWAPGNILTVCETGEKGWPVGSDAQ